MNNFGSFGSKYWKSNESRLLNDVSNLGLQLERLTNLGDPKSEKDVMNLQNLKTILKNFEVEVINQQIITNQCLNKDINR